MNEDLSSLNLVELLELLEPIPEPAPVSLWPQAVGWLWLALVLVAVLAWLVHRFLRHRRTNEYRRAALAEIATAGDDPAALAEILRRTALAAYPRSEVAGLHGEEWLAFLDRTLGGAEFRQGPGQALTLAPYAAPDSSAASSELAALVTRWVRKHRRGPSRVAS